MLWFITKRICRNPRHILAISIGILLSISLIVGTSVAVDEVTHAVFEDRLSRIPVDFFIDRYIEVPNQLPNVQGIKSQLFKISEIKGIEIAWHFNIPTQIFSRVRLEGNESVFESILASVPDQNIVPFTLLGVPSDFGKNISGITWIAGNVTANQNNSIAVSETFANVHNLSVGDAFYLSSLHGYFSNSTLNFTFVYSVKFIVSGIYRFEPVLNTTIHTIEGNKIVFLTSFRNAYNIYNMLTQNYIDIIESKRETDTNFDTSGNTSIQMFPATSLIYRIYVFLNRKVIYNIWTIDQIEFEIQRIQDSIFVHLSMDRKYTISYVAQSVVNELTEWSRKIRMNLVIFYFPILIIGTFLSMAFSYAAVNERKKELNLLLMRGATEKQIKVLLFAEGLIAGIFGSGVGAILAAIFATLIRYFVVSAWKVTTVSNTALPLTNTIIVNSFLLGVALSLLAVSLATGETKFIIKTEEKEKPILQKILRKENTRIKLLIVGELLSIYKIIAWLVQFSPYELLISIANENFMLMAIILVFKVIDNLILDPLAPIIFIYCTGRLVFSHIDKIITRVNITVDRYFKNTITKMASRRIFHYNKRFVRVGVVLSMAIGLGVFVPIVNASLLHYQVRVIKVNNGADINVKVQELATESKINSIMQMTSNLTGVQNVSMIYRVLIQMRDYSFLSFALDPESYLSTTREYINENFSQNGLIESIQKMSKNTTYALATYSFLRDTGLHIGDEINVAVSVNETYSAKFAIQIIDSVYVLPGLAPGEIKPVDKQALILNSALLRRNYAIYAKNYTYCLVYSILIDTDTANNSMKVGKYIRDRYTNRYSLDSVFSNEYATVYITQEQIDALNRNPLVITSYILLDVNSFVVFFMAIIGVGAVLLIETEGRKREIAILIARGASTTQVFVILFTEISIVVMISLLLGLTTGYIGSLETIRYTIARMTTGNYMSSGIANALRPEALIPFAIAYMIIGMLASMIIITVISLIQIQHINIRETLQEEINQ